MSALNFGHYYAGLPVPATRAHHAADPVDPDAYAAQLRMRAVLAVLAVVFGAGVVVGIMLGQGHPKRAPSPNVCRTEEVSRIDCVHVTTAVPVSGVAR